VQLFFVIGLAGAILVAYCSRSLLRAATKKVWAATYTASLLPASFIYVWFTISSRILQISLKY
jgi:hypothetical protein